tara:strand:- start:2192 stop:3727 length:1536 start_codon:yes stop_codon:yes gene_type:complete
MNETLVKHLNFGEDARNKVFTGIEKLANAVSSTLGASGKCVIMEDNTGNPQITKDGVTVANCITLLDPVENMGAKLIKEAARKTVKEAGDGTTTATVLAHAIIDEAHKLKEFNTRDLKEGINLAVEKVVHYLEKTSSKVRGKKIKQVATISANNDLELGNIIDEAFKSVDNTGVVLMETHEDPTTEVERIEGVQYDQGYMSPHFITNQNEKTAELINPLVLVLGNTVENIRKIQGILEHVIKSGKSLLIIGDLEPQVSSALAMNKVKGNIKVNVIHAPVYGTNRMEILDDIALITGATVIDEELGDDMDLISEEHLGSCTKSISKENETLLQLDSMPEEVDALISSIKNKIKSESRPALKQKHEKRLARLMAKVAVIKVGANSEVELQEKKDRVEDAICATKAAIKEGIVPGGGIALLNASQKLTSNSIGEKVLYEAIKKPFEVIMHNAGMEWQIIPKEGTGYDVVTGNTVDMVKAGIIDPLLVTKSALKNAASVATTILSTDCVINNIRA